MKAQFSIAFFLIYALIGCHDIYATPVSDTTQDNITRPATAEMKTRGNLRGVIRSIFRGYHIPPVIHEKVKPPVEFYLDPPRFSQKDKSRLA
jgi:hypothetical protein